MSRRSHQKRDEMLNRLVEPTSNQHIVRIKAIRGQGTLDVELPDGKEVMARMPNQFKDVVFFKLGNYLIIEETGTEQRQFYEVAHMLWKEQIQHLKSLSLWPSIFEEEAPEKIPDTTQQPLGYGSDDDLPLANSNRRPANVFEVCMYVCM